MTSISRTAFIRCISTTIAGTTLRAPPISPDPPPYGTTRHPSLRRQPHDRRHFLRGSRPHDGNRRDLGRTIDLPRPASVVAVRRDLIPIAHNAIVANDRDERSSQVLLFDEGHGSLQWPLEFSPFMRNAATHYDRTPND